MKKIFFLLSVFASSAFAQQFPIVAWRMFDSWLDIDYDIQIEQILPQLQYAYFNYGVAITKTWTPSETNALLDEAGNRNLKIIAYDTDFGKYSKTERFYHDASARYFASIDPSNPQDDALANRPYDDATWYDGQSLKGTAANGYIVRDAKYSVIPKYYNDHSYIANFRLKALKQPGTPGTTPVVEIQVVDITDNTRTATQTLIADNFQYDNTYYLFSVAFKSCETSPSPPPCEPCVHLLNMALAVPSTLTETVCEPHKFDLRVKWLGGPVQVWLDWIRVDNDLDSHTPYNAEDLFNGAYNNTIKNYVETYNGKPALARYYLFDEPYYNQWRTHNYVNEVLKTANYANDSTGKGLGHTAFHELFKDPADGNPYNRSAQESRPYELTPDAYRFKSDDPLQGAGDYTSKIQENVAEFHGLQSLDTTYRRAQLGSQFAGSQRWWAYVNAGEFPPYSREPYVSELRAQINLALAYGAKGIGYFHYISYANFASATGIISESNLEPITYNVRQENKWEGIRAINQKLAGALGQTLLGLNFQGGKSWHNSSTFTWSGIVTTVTAKNSGGTPDPAGTTYVETTHFRDISAVDYVFVLNRRTRNDETRNITVSLNKTGFNEVQEISSGKKWIIGSYGSFTDNFAPGDGKLYKVATLSYNWSGDITVMSTVTVPSGTTLTVSAGSTLRFQPGIDLNLYGKLTAVGAWNNRITFTSTGGQSPASWGSLILSGSGASGSYIYQADILYGHRVYVVNASNVTLQASNILVTNWGIEFSGATGAILQCTLTQPTYFHGIVIQNGSTVTCNQNTLTKQQPYLNRGFGLLYNSGSGGNVYQNDIYAWSSGVGAIWESSPQFYCATNDGRNNRIRSCNLGVEVYGWSYPVICPDLAYEFWYWWGNSIYGNGYNVALNTPGYNTSELPAQLTWWGETPYPSMFAVGSGSNVDYDNWFDYDPWDGYGLMAGGDGESQSVRTPPISQLAQASEEKKESLIQGTLLRLQGKFLEAKDYFLQYIAKYPDDQAAYVELYNCYDQETAEEITKFFELLPQTAAKEHGLLLGYLYLKQGKVAIAKQVNDALIQKNPDSRLAARAKLNNFYIALYHENNSKAASTMLHEVVTKAELSTEIELALAQEDLESYTPAKAAGESNVQAAGVVGGLLNPAEEKEQSPADQLEIFPNPFNPTTTIRYSIADEGFVSLTVYDMVGREVSVLVDGNKQAGYHSVTWDASRFPSGIYFARMEANGKILLKKLALVK